ncbi:bifunctional diguanylate cyclase/phosphodiesterase [Acetobacter peroxydans]|uniref:Bifunctional diguanylate cyclase/phosphodiesterase n=2 Tax=Acetobacter peroxydans TaxID=104098 RepID=A0A4Y3TW40_9PROT|nr:bifunctional diguanylate cyclase/phosphodiesterase [Acetobacter peroxydans]
MPAPYPMPSNEAERLKALAEYHLMDTPREEDFDRLTGLASRLFNVPIVTISLLDYDRLFSKANIGFGFTEISREVSFSAYVIMGDDIVVVPDTTKDPRFSSNPMVLGPPFIRFYVGIPLVAPFGEKIGTLSLIDTKPRADFTIEDRRNLTDIAALVMDRMEIRRLDHVRTVNQARFENVAATFSDAIICANAAAQITFWNHSAERLFGYSPAEVVGQRSDIIVAESDRNIYGALLERLRHGLRMERPYKSIELLALRKDGSEFPAEFSLSSWKEGKTTSVNIIVRDVTERRINEEHLFRLAATDALTNLPNRAVWRERLEQTMAAERPATILLLDLDGFKEVNETLGHSAGDAILQEVALRLRSVCSTAIMVARLGGNEFVVLLSGNDERQARTVAGELIGAISMPYEVSGQRCHIGVSIGGALGPQHGSRPDDLFAAADMALYRAKSTGKGHFELFEPRLREVAVLRRAFEQELRFAFENGEFEVFYQPQVSLSNSRVVGAEALMRWSHPQQGLLSPASFMEVLSQKPSASAVGEWVLRTACQQAAKWQSAIPGFRMGVNLFEAQCRSGRLVTLVREVLTETRLSPENLELEIVENVLLHNDAVTLRMLQDLRSLGVGLAFDDYGTGFAALSLLKRYPVTRLKIDRSFVRDVNTDPTDAAVVKAIQYLGRSFGMDVIAEGVETEAQLNFLKQVGCNEAQGYLFGRPMTAAQFSQLFVDVGPPA